MHKMPAFVNFYLEAQNLVPAKTLQRNKDVLLFRKCVGEKSCLLLILRRPKIKTYISLIHRPCINTAYSIVLSGKIITRGDRNNSLTPIQSERTARRYSLDYSPLLTSATVSPNMRDFASQGL